MPVRFNIDIVTPLDASDKEVLAGVAMFVMSVAVGNQMPEQPEPEQPCGAPSANGGICISPVGHKGRHRFRPVPVTPEMVN